MPSFFRLMVIVGMAALFPALLVWWQQSAPPATMTTPSTDSPPVSSKMFGTSAISHGSPNTVSSMPNQLVVDHGGFESGQTALFKKEDASGPTEVVIAKREIRRLPDGRMQDLYEVRFADGTTTWANRQSLRISDQRNEPSNKER